MKLLRQTLSENHRDQLYGGNKRQPGDFPLQIGDSNRTDPRGALMKDIAAKKASGLSQTGKVAATNELLAKLKDSKIHKDYMAKKAKDLARRTKSADTRARNKVAKAKAPEVTASTTPSAKPSLMSRVTSILGLARKRA